MRPQNLSLMGSCEYSSCRTRWIDSRSLHSYHPFVTLYGNIVLFVIWVFPTVVWFMTVTGTPPSTRIDSSQSEVLIGAWVSTVAFLTIAGCSLIFSSSSWSSIFSSASSCPSLNVFELGTTVECCGKIETVCGEIETESWQSSCLAPVSAT